MTTSAVLVTRGDVPLSGIFDTWFRLDIAIWDNSQQINMGVFGRWIEAAQQRTDLVYVQDDDCVTDPEQIIAAWEPGKVVCNMPLEYRPNYTGLDKLVGFGCVFERALVKPTFERYFKYYVDCDALFRRECDRIFTGLVSEHIKLVDVPMRHLPWASAPDRLWKQPEHAHNTHLARERVKHTLHYEELARVGAEARQRQTDVPA